MRLGLPRTNAATRAIATSVLLVGLSLLGTTLVVAPASATPWSGSEPTPTNLQFYLHNSSVGITVGAVSYLNVLSTGPDNATPWAGTGELTVGTHYDSASFVLAPQLAGPLTINGTVEANVYMNESGSSPTGGSITITAYAVDPIGTLTLLGVGPADPTAPLGPGGSLPNLVQLVGPTLNVTVPAGNTVEFNITISGNTAESYGIWWGTVGGTIYPSSISVPASTYLTVPLVEVLNSTGVPVVDLTQSASSFVVTVVANVSDPLGAYDFENFSVNFSVVNESGVAVIGPTPMTPVPGLAAPGALNGTYNATFNYSTLPPGFYNVTVNASDNTNHNLGAQNTLPTYFGRAASGKVEVEVGLPPVPVSVTVLDDKNLPLHGATVRAKVGAATVQTNVTNATGGANFSLPNGITYVFVVVWQGVVVGNISESVTTADQVFVLHPSVVYPTFQLNTAAGDAVPYALVTVVHPNGTVLPLEISGPTGAFTLDQVPAGKYTLSVIFDDAQVVGPTAIAVTSDGPIPVLVGNVYALTVYTSDSSGAGLSNVFVQVINVTTGATIASGVTTSTGQLRFLAPAGTYLVVGSWSATFDFTDLHETESATVIVSGATSTHLTYSKAFPAFTATNEFYVILGFAILGVLLAILAVLIIRLRRRLASPPSPPSAWSEGQKKGEGTEPGGEKEGPGKT